MRNAFVKALGLVVSCAITLAGGISSIPAMAATSSFTDVASGAYYADAVSWAVSNGVTSGVSDTKFGVGETCTRGQIVTFLWRAAGSPEPSNPDAGFTDVDPNNPKHYFRKAVAWAVENGITGGTSATTFSPGEECTRAQIVTFLYKYKHGSAGYISMFDDVASGKYYDHAVTWAYLNHVTGGKSDTRFGSDDTCTREQAMTFLYNAEQLDDASPAYVDVTDYGAVPNDGQDDTAAIHSAIAALGGGDRNVIYFPAGTYNCSAGLSQGGAVILHTDRLTHNVSVLLDDGATLQMMDSTDSNGNALINAWNIDHLQIIGGTLSGLRDMSVSSREDAYGIELKHCTNVTIRNVKIHDLRGDGIYVGPDNGQQSANVTVENVESTNNMRHGIAIISANHVTVRNSTFSNNSGAEQSDGISIENNPGDSASSDITVENCTMNNNGFLGLLTYTTAGPHSNIYLRNCTANGNHCVISGQTVNVMLWPNSATNFNIENSTIGGRTVNQSGITAGNNDWAKRW